MSPAPLPPVTVLGRAPERGRVKTRLAATLGDEVACEFHAALALDVVRCLSDWLRRRGAAEGSLVLALTGDEDAAARFGASVTERHPLRLERQSEGDLGARIREALERRASDGAPASLVVGTDAPLLPDSLLDGATAALAEGRPALAPSTDGGFVLLGTTPLPARAFAGVSWGGPEVLATTRAGLERCGLEPRLLETAEDVDEEADLRRLAAILADEPQRAPETARLLAGRSWTRPA